MISGLLKHPLPPIAPFKVGWRAGGRPFEGAWLVAGDVSKSKSNFLHNVLNG
jgi:hypothetical protein